MKASGEGEEGSRVEYARDGPEARRIARTIPYFPFKGIDRFYDIGGETNKQYVGQIASASSISKQCLTSTGSARHVRSGRSWVGGTAVITYALL